MHRPEWAPDSVVVVVVIVAVSVSATCKLNLLTHQVITTQHGAAGSGPHGPCATVSVTSMHQPVPSDSIISDHDFKIHRSSRRNGATGFRSD